MKKITTIAIAILLATSIVAPANAGSWFKIEQPCGSKCVVPQPTARLPGGVRFREFKDPDYQSRTVITSDYGTTVYTYRSYSR